MKGTETQQTARKEKDMFAVYEIFPDGKKFFRFESDDRFECEVYVDHHKYNHRVSRLEIVERR